MCVYEAVLHVVVTARGEGFPECLTLPLSLAGARAPKCGVHRQGDVLTDIQSLLDCQ
jgi:hypothetical protein